MFGRGKEESPVEHGRYYLQPVGQTDRIGTEKQLANIQEALNEGESRGWKLMQFSPPAGPQPATLLWDTGA